MEKLALGSVLLLFVADMLPIAPAVVAAIALFGAIAHGVRLFLWRSWRTLRVPLVWVLHAAYAWIVAYLALRALAAMGWIAQSFAIHALTVGAIGGLTLGMMTRTARGHTARPLVADGFELHMFCADTTRRAGPCLLRPGGARTVFGQYSTVRDALGGRIWPVRHSLLAGADAAPA